MNIFNNPPFRIIHDESGQLCNRFWSYIDSIAWGIKSHKKVYIIFWDRNICDFDKLRENKIVKFPFYKKSWVKKYGDSKIQDTIRKYWPRNRFFAKLFYVNPYLKIFIYGWPDRCTMKYYPSILDKVKPLFRPNDSIVESATSLILSYKRKDSILVGVHIRKGDYEHFFNGHFNYSYSQYANWMFQVKNLYPNKQVYFYIASNEDVPVEYFRGLNICDKTKIKATAAFDLYALSLCDRILGPISTFSRWASFYGDVPLCFVSQHFKFKSDAQFSPIVDYAHFENGKEIMSLTAYYWRCKSLGINLQL